jgi:hypothetical protein
VLFRGRVGADYEKGKKHASWLILQYSVFKLYIRCHIKLTFGFKELCNKQLTRNQQNNQTKKPTNQPELLNQLKRTAGYFSKGHSADHHIFFTFYKFQVFITMVTEIHH